MAGFTIQEMYVGQKASVTDHVTREVVLAFADVTGDHNPVHVDEEFGKNSRFGKNIAHGMLMAGYISKVLGTQLPGEGCIYAKQDISFRAPLYVGETVITEVEVKELIPEKNRVILKTTCRDGKGNAPGRDGVHQLHKRESGRSVRRHVGRGSAGKAPARKIS